MSAGVGHAVKVGTLGPFYGLLYLVYKRIAAGKEARLFNIAVYRAADYLKLLKRLFSQNFYISEAMIGKTGLVGFKFIPL